jgi:Zn-dependent protease
LRTWFMTPTRRTLVSLAGPAANLVLAVLLLALTRSFFDPDHWVLWAGVAFLGFLQIMAVVLNLLPIPGLDGYDALEPHLSPETQRAVAPFKQYGVFILLFVLLAPALNRWLFGIVDWFFEFSGVPHMLASAGDSLTRFWSQWI